MTGEDRYWLKKRKLSFRERVKIWFDGLMDAIKWVPPREVSKYVLLRPGDPGYEIAVYRMDPNPVRYTFTEHGFVREDPSEMGTEENPEWNTPHGV